MNLDQAPQGRPLRVASVQGGEAVRRRLLGLGLRPGTLVEVDARGILRGPLLIRNLASDTSLALGRSVAQKIQVEIAADEP